MIERDLAHLRFLFVRVAKGEYLTSEDLDFVLKMQVEIKAVYEGIEEILESQRMLEACL